MCEQVCLLKLSNSLGKVLLISFLLPFPQHNIMHEKWIFFLLKKNFNKCLHKCHGQSLNSHKMIDIFPILYCSWAIIRFAFVLLTIGPVIALFSWNLAFQLSFKVLALYLLLFVHSMFRKIYIAKGKGKLRIIHVIFKNEK